MRYAAALALLVVAGCTDAMPTSPVTGKYTVTRTMGTEHYGDFQSVDTYELAVSDLGVVVVGQGPAIDATSVARSSSDLGFTSIERLTSSMGTVTPPQIDYYLEGDGDRLVGRAEALSHTATAGNPDLLIDLSWNVEALRQ
jgi:hypothetical protein